MAGSVPDLTEPDRTVFDVRAPCVRCETIQMKATEQYFLWCNLFCCTMWFCFIQKCDHSNSVDTFITSSRSVAMLLFIMRQ